MNLLKKHIQPVAAGALLPSPAACGEDAAQDSGKEAVRFTVDLSVGEDGTVSLPGIQASLAVNSPHVQLTVTDVPSEDYAASCHLSDGGESAAAILPTDPGTCQRTVAGFGDENYTGSSQFTFTIPEA